MRDLFSEDRGLDLPRAGDMTAMDPAGATGLGQGLGGRYPLEGRHVCPFCGAVNETMEGPCPQCTMSNTAETRKATKSRIGPWYVLQSRNPAAPGMRYETLLGFVRKGRVKARSIVRGPTTHQLWRFACQVKGLSREFGLCYSCGGSIERDAQLCPQCNRLQDPPADPDVFVEGQGSPAAPALEPLAPASKPVAPAEALRETRAGPIYKELKLPPLSDFPSIASAAATAVPAPVAPTAATRAAPANAPADAPSVAKAISPPPPAEPARAAPPAATPQSVPTAAPAGPPKRNANDVFLSAKDLAAAFQLGFDGDEGRARDGSDAESEALWGGSSSARNPARAAYRRPRRKRRIGRMILFLLLLGIGGFAAYLAVFDWAEAQYMALTGANLYPDLARSRAGNGAPPTTAASPSDTASEAYPAAASVLPPRVGAPSSDAPPAWPTTRSVPEARARGIDPAAGEGKGASPIAPPIAPPERPRATTSPVIPTPHESGLPASTAPAPERLSPRAGSRTQPGPSRPQSDARAVGSTQPSRPVPPSPQQSPVEPRPLTTDDARRKSAQLWAEALNAEDLGDYGKAKALYEQMMKLPREVWYRGVEGRLQFAKDQLGEK